MPRQVRVRVAPSQSLLPTDEEFAADDEWSLFFESDEECEISYGEKKGKYMSQLDVTLPRI